MTTYGYIRTSRQRIQGTSGSDPAAQAHQLHRDGVPEANIHRDVGISGGTGTNSRAGWRALDAKLVSRDTLVVVAIDRIGRRWMDTVNAVRDLRTREVKIRSLAQSEATWVTYLDAEPDTAEAVIGDILTTFMAWAAEQELQAVSRRTRAGLEKARAEGKTLGPPRIVDDDQVEAMARLRREGHSLRSIGSFSEYRALRCNGGCRKLCILRKTPMTGEEKDLLKKYLTHLNVLGKDGSHPNSEAWYQEVRYAQGPNAPHNLMEASELRYKDILDAARVFSQLQESHPRA